MGSMPQYKGLNSVRIEQVIDNSLLIAIRTIVLVFFLIVTAMSFLFAIVLTSVCLFAAGLSLMLRFVAQRQETQRLFALAGC